MARGETPIDHCLCSVYLLCFPLYVSIDMSKRINVLKIPISSLRQSRPKWSIESRAAYHQYVQILLAWKKNHFQNQINLETLVFYSPRMREIIKSAITIAVWMCFFFFIGITVAAAIVTTAATVATTIAHSFSPFHKCYVCIFVYI